MADFITIVVLVVIVVILVNIFKSSNSKTPSNVQSYPINRNRARQQQVAPRKKIPDKKVNYFVESAKNQASLGNFDEASRLYLQANQTYQAAKMKMMKGPQAAPAAIDIIRLKSSNPEVVINRLVDEFYNRLQKPANSVALLRAAGYFDRADALAVATGLMVPEEQVIEEPMATSTRTEKESVVEEAPEFSSKLDIDEIEELEEDELDKFLETATEKVANKIINKEEAMKKDIPNTLMLAPTDLKETCVACRRQIKAGDSFIYCLNCGKAGHYKHLGEMIKVTGKCPSCKKRLVLSMYDFE